MFTVPWRSESGRWGGPPRPWWNTPLKWPWVGAAALQNGWSRPETTSFLSPRGQGKRSEGLYPHAQTGGWVEWQEVPISKLPSIRPTCVVEMSKCLSICVMELFMCVAVRDLEKQAKDSTKINICKTEGRRQAVRIAPTVHRTYRKVTVPITKTKRFVFNWNWRRALSVQQLRMGLNLVYLLNTFLFNHIRNDTIQLPTRAAAKMWKEKKVH